MSPLRIETFRVSPEGVRTTKTKEADQSFPIGPGEASKVLGVSRTTLFRYLKSSGIEKNMKRQVITIAPEPSRVIGDEDLLKIARSLKVGGPKIVEHDGTGLVELITPSTRTLLDISHKSKK